MVQFSPLNIPETDLSQTQDWKASILFLHVNLLKYGSPSAGRGNTFTYLQHVPKLLAKDALARVYTTGSDHLCTELLPYTVLGMNMIPFREQVSQEIDHFDNDYHDFMGF